MDKEVKIDWAIPLTWEKTKLDDISLIIQGQSPPSSTYNLEGIGLPFFQGKADFTEMYPIGRVWCSEPNKIAEPNDILLSVRAPVGSTNIANVKCGIGRGLSAIRYEHCYKFVFYYLRFIERELDKRGTGTTFKAISGDVVRNINIPFPPSKEQNRIVKKLDEVFSELEKGKEQMQNSLELLNVYRQSVLKYAFEGKLIQTSKILINESIEDLLNKIAKDKLDQNEKDVEIAKEHHKSKPQKIFFPDLLINYELFELPKNWLWTTIFSISDRESNAVVDGPFGSNLKTSDYVEKGEYPVISITNIDEGFAPNQVRYITTKKYQELKRSSVNPGDILVAKIGSSYGKVGVYPDNMKTGIIPANLLKLTVSPRINKAYILYYLKSGYFKKHIDRITKSTAQPAFNVSMFRALPIPLPPREIQDMIVDELDAISSNCDKILTTIQQSLTNSECLKQSLLQKAFEGKLFEQNPNDEPAGVLLERIKKEREAILKAEKERKKSEKPLTKKLRNMAEELKCIMDILKENDGPISAKTLWQSSTHKDDIDEFYAELKMQIEAGEIIEIPRQGKESYLRLADAK